MRNYKDDLNASQEIKNMENGQMINDSDQSFWEKSMDDPSFHLSSHYVRHCTMHKEHKDGK